MKTCLIGLDLGTSSVKAGLYDLQGHELAVARARLSISSPEAGWAEQDPREWERAAATVLREAASMASEGSIQAIGLSGQCPGHVLVTASGEPIGQAIIWRDRRATKEASWLAANVSSAEAVGWVGSSSLGDATMPPARLLWLKQNKPADWAKAAFILQPKDYLGMLLTGKAGSDRHSSFLLVNPQTRRVHPGLLKILGCDESIFPPAGNVTDQLGALTQTMSAATGIPVGTAVFTGTIDAYCEILAGGGFLPGQAVDVAGTSEMIALGVRRYDPSTSVFADQLEGAGTFLCGPTQSGCGLQDWLARVFYPEMIGQANPAVLEKEAAAVLPGADGLLFLPYIHGERAPIWDAQATGAFLGITGNHDRRHFSRAVYESVAFVVRHVLDLCSEAGGMAVESVVVCGGGSRSNFWNQVKADVLQKPVQPLMAQASACLGAAMLAAAGCGLYAGLAEASGKMRQNAAVHQPDPGLAALYDEKYRLYRQIYPMLHSLRGNA